MAAVTAFQEAGQGHWPSAGHLVTLVAYALVAAGAAARLFRWE
jgi:ABC-2 type transport system permease protein